MTGGAVTGTTNSNRISEDGGSRVRWKWIKNMEGEVKMRVWGGILFTFFFIFIFFSYDFLKLFGLDKSINVDGIKGGKRGRDSWPSGFFLLFSSFLASLHS